MKIALFSPLNVIRGVALGTIVSGFAGALAVAAVATPIDAFATEAASAHHSVHKKHLKKEEHVAASKAAASKIEVAKEGGRHERTRYTLRAHGRHGVVHRVAFEPRHEGTACRPYQ